MPITLITGPANAGKAGVAMDTLRAHCARGEQPLLVVPTAADVERYRQELAPEHAQEGGAGGVRVERFDGLLAEVLHRGGTPERPLGRIAAEQALAAALRHSGGELRPTPGVVRALAAVVGELEVERVSPARLRAALEQWAACDPAHASHARELAELFARYHRTLGRLRPPRAGLERRAAGALDALRRSPARWGATPMVMYGFDDFTRLQLDTIETLGGVVGAPVTVSLTYEPGRVALASRGDTFQRLLPLAAEHRQLGSRADHYALDARIPLHHLERHLFEPDAPPPVPAGAALRLLEGAGEREELELVAKEIAVLLADGLPPGEIAVAHRSPETIAELLEEVFDAHSIPFALRRRPPLRRTATGRALLGLLKAAFAEAPDDGGANDLLAWLRAPGVLPEPELADALELRARRAGAVGVARVRALWELEHPALDVLDGLQEARNPAALIERVLAEFRRLGFDSPLDTCASATAEEALRQLRDLADAAPELAPGPGELIALLGELELVVGETPGFSGAVAVSEAVAVLDPLALRARRVRVLFLCGLQEGLFPAPARPEPYLSEEERRGLAEASGLRLGRPGDALARERYLLYAAVSRPWERLVLSWHTADDDGLPTPRSLFVDDICDLFADDPQAIRVRRALPLAAIAPQRSAEPFVSPPPAEPIAPLRDPRVLAELDERRLWSASGLQSWAGCPVQWLVERLLGARDLEPEAEPLARGGLAHAALRQTFARLREETGSARVTPTNLPLARELLRVALEEHAHEHPLSTAPERVPGVRRRLEADLERYLEHAAGSGPETAPAGGGPEHNTVEGGGKQLDLVEEPWVIPLEPTYLELPFGFADAPDGLPALDVGEDVRVRGYIDRVDLASTGEAVVYDYKGSFAPPPDRWLSERSFQVALYMRAVERLLKVPTVGGFYQPLSGRDLRARGVLADGEGVALDCVRGDARPAEEVGELVEQVVAAAREAALQARAGELQPRPDTCGFGGGGCMYPSICRCER